MAHLKNFPVQWPVFKPWSRMTVTVPAFPALYRDPLHERPGVAAAFVTRHNSLWISPSS